jgi:hypothetical protein
MHAAPYETPAMSYGCRPLYNRNMEVATYMITFKDQSKRDSILRQLMALERKLTIVRRTFSEC